MPLSIEKQIARNSCMALWSITESTKELLKQLNCEIDPALLAVNEQLQKQRICARILINKLCGIPFCDIRYDEFNKPHLINSNYKISISHAHSQVAVIINKANETGIDIELIKPQVERIATRFMSEEELLETNSAQKIERLTIYWCAKETLYKYYGKKELVFKQNIFIEPFNQHNSGNIIGYIRTAHVQITVPLFYEKIDKYMLVYVND